ncbi:RelA/SpoT domain-containing protein [Pelagibius litoralis]|uniref:RelA/SpoT domain-containing protein n=1 Tax=Pelagibius litoralis TaxID=374515 RepID=A0A967F0U7_9PROT|nr:RelA/SpoT domain-containing protein [Pelagibius litoralis]NIA70989.1 RelA/SpoT domain-containing protein [Pelagibius litoralis]
MNFEEYQLAGRSRFSALVEAIQYILKAAVEAQGMEPHAITGRAKNPKSLARKLVNREIDPASEIDEQIKDLAGVRIVFLTNSQIYAFNQAGILRDNFDILAVNAHHAVPGLLQTARPDQADDSARLSRGHERRAFATAHVAPVRHRRGRRSGVRSSLRLPVDR